MNEEFQTGLVIEPDNNRYEIVANLQNLQKAVGGYVECIRIDSGTMWLNEEGKLQGLEWNPFAQALFDATYGTNIDIIVGPVVITHD